MKRRPFEEGWDAGVRGYEDPRVICPYKKMTKERKEWEKFYAWGAKFRAATLSKKDSIIARLAKKIGIQ